MGTAVDRIGATRRRSALRALLVAAGVAAVSGLLVWRWGDVRESVAALTSVRPGWIALAGLLAFLTTLIRAAAWGIVVDSAVRARPPAAAICSAFLVGQCGNVLLPGRLGEAAKVASLARRAPGERWETLAGTVVAHRMLDAAPIAALTAVLVVTVGIPGGLGTETAVAVGVATLILIFGVLVALRATEPSDGAGRLRRSLFEVRAGMAVLRRPGPAVLATIVQTAALTSAVAAAWATLRAFGLSGFAEAAMVVLALTVVAALPLWPGNVGVVQLGIAGVLVPMGVATTTAIGYGVLFQALDLVVALAPGVAVLGWQGVRAGVVRARNGAPLGVGPLGVGDPEEDRPTASRAR